ncbi:hypothetical protein HWV07_08505 [Natronomonas salina]|nr:hypothetical protein HWV07_08505 [Natronomonas salina]
MWGIDPTLLCDQHLLGEHTEMHQEAGTIENHPHGTAIVEGHAERQQVDTSLIQRRHDELAAELRRRGMNHDSPLDYEDDLDLGSIDTAANRDDLMERCDECRRRIEAADASDAERGPD